MQLVVAEVIEVARVTATGAKAGDLVVPASVAATPPRPPPPPTAAATASTPTTANAAISCTPQLLRTAFAKAAIALGINTAWYVTRYGSGFRVYFDAKVPAIQPLAWCSVAARISPSLPFRS